MRNFEFFTPTRIMFGKAMEEKAGELAVEYGNKVLLHYGKGHIKKTGLLDKVICSLEAKGVKVFELGGVKPNPEISLVREGIKICRENNIDFILAVGGGSTIDSAKAISIGVPYDGDVWDFYFKGVIPKKALPIGAVLTIPAAGSEMSKVSVITNGSYKVGFASDIIRPKFAILNPELTYTLPKWQTAAGIVDIMAHVMERYFTEEKYVDFSDRMCEGLIESMIKYAPVVMDEPSNYNARAEIMWAGAIAHNGLLGMGRIEDWASHRIEMPLSAIYDLTHGAGLSIIFPAWIRYVAKKKPGPFIKFFTRIFNIDYDFDYPESVIKTGLTMLEDFYKSIGMPVRLQEVEIDDARFEEMAQIVTVKSAQGNLLKLQKEDIIEIYKLALEG